MPVRVSVRDLDSPLVLQPRAQGGFARASRPNPNSAIETWKRRGNADVVGGTSSMSQLPQANATNPAIDGLAENINLAERARLHRAMFEADELEARAGNDGLASIRRIDTVGRDPRFDALFQAMYESGATRARTGARAGWDRPGFFDGPRESLQQQRLADELFASDVNRVTANAQRDRRLEDADERIRRARAGVAEANERLAGLGLARWSK